MEAPHVSLLYLRWVVLFLRLKSAHRACGVAPSVGMRDGQANELHSTTPCMTLTTSMADRGQRGEAAGAGRDVTQAKH
jgi:hypothetical protein